MINVQKTLRVLLRCCAVGAAGCVANPAPSAPWEKLAPLPVPGGNFALGAVKGRIIAAGGISWRGGEKLWLDAVHSYDPEKNAWTALAPLPAANAYSAFCVREDSLFLAGGSDGKNSREELVRLAPDGAVTTRSLPLRRAYAGSASVEGRLYIVSGSEDVADLSAMTSKCHEVDLLAGRMAAVPDYPGGAVMLPACAAVNGKLYAFGGAHSQTSATVTNTAASFAYDTKTETWEKLAALPEPVRGLAACALDEKRILLAGGYTGGFTDRIWVYHTETNTYASAPPLPYPAFASLVKLGDYVYWIGGEDRMKGRTDAVHRARWRDLGKEPNR